MGRRIDRMPASRSFRDGCLSLAVVSDHLSSSHSSTRLYPHQMPRGEMIANPWTKWEKDMRMRKARNALSHSARVGNDSFEEGSVELPAPYSQTLIPSAFHEIDTHTCTRRTRCRLKSVRWWVMDKRFENNR